MLLVEPCSIHHIESLLAGREYFFNTFGIAIADDYELMPDLLEFSLKPLIEGSVLPRWWTHLAILDDPRIVVGIVGYKFFEDEEDGKIWRWEVQQTSVNSAIKRSEEG